MKVHFLENWDVLDDRGDNTLIDVLKRWDEKMNAFAPHKQEGIVKKLKDFKTKDD